MISLTQKNGKAVYINPEHVIYVYGLDNGIIMIQLTHGASLTIEGGNLEEIVGLMIKKLSPSKEPSEESL